MTSGRSLGGLLLLLGYFAAALTLICVGAERIPRQTGRTFRMDQTPEITEEETEAYRQSVLVSEGFKLTMIGVGMFGLGMLVYCLVQCKEELKFYRAARVEPQQQPQPPLPV